MKIYSIFNIDRLKSYYKEVFKVKENQSEIIKEVKE